MHNWLRAAFYISHYTFYILFINNDFLCIGYLFALIALHTCAVEIYAGAKREACAGAESPGYGVGAGGGCSGSCVRPKQMAREIEYLECERTLAARAVVRENE